MVASAEKVAVRAGRPVRSQAKAGRAALEVQLVSGQSSVTSAFATSPMKLLTPRARGAAVWACISSFGGGLVAGDQTRLKLHVGPGAGCHVGTQASTKIYRNPGSLPSGHETQAMLEGGSLLAFVPDPVQAFAGSTYTQRQEFQLAADASLVLLDWFTSGRAACGERWAFSHFASRNEVFVAGERVFLDSIRFEGRFDSPFRTGRFNCLATLLMVGSRVRQFATTLLTGIAERSVERRAALVCSASPIRDGALFRVAGEHVESVAREIHAHLLPLASLLGDDPWARKW